MHFVLLCLPDRTGYQESEKGALRRKLIFIDVSQPHMSFSNENVDVTVRVTVSVYVLCLDSC